MNKKYSPAIVAELKKLFVQEGLSAEAIASMSRDYPSAVTIRKYSRTPDSATGLTWVDERRDFTEFKYNMISPLSLGEKILEKIYFIASTDNASFTSKESDAMIKMWKNYKELIDPKHQLPVLLQFLHDFLTFLEKHYKDLIDEGRILTAFKDFKKHKLEEMQNI